jgi:hypothetical protein
VAHAYDHIRKNEAYGIHTWDPATAGSTLVIYPMERPFARPQLQEMRRRRKWKTFIDGSRLKTMEEGKMFVRWTIK